MSNQEQALNLVLSNIRQAFTTMNNFEVFPGLSLLHFLIVLLILHILISLFTHLVTVPIRMSLKPERRHSDRSGGSHSGSDGRSD